MSPKSEISVWAVQAWAQYGDTERAFAAIERMTYAQPWSAAVALTHANMLREEDPQGALSRVQQLLDHDASGHRDSPVRAALFASAAVSLTACGRLGDAVDTLNEAVVMAKKLEHKRAQDDRAFKEGHANVEPTKESSSEAVKVEDPDNDDSDAAWRRRPPSFLHGDQMTEPKLFVGSEVAAARAEKVWLEDELTAARITLSSALVIHDAELAREMACAAVKSGRHQDRSHEAAAHACIALKDFAAAKKFIKAGLKTNATHGGLLRMFSRMLSAQDLTQDAIKVATYAKDIASLGTSRLSSRTRDGYLGVRKEILGL
jgi:hypothetical protein